MKVDEGDRTQPYAYADPRSLSEAWYDALYGSHAQKRPQSVAPSSPQKANESAALPRGSEDAGSGMESSRVIPVSHLRASIAVEKAIFDEDESPAVAARKRVRGSRPAEVSDTDVSERSDVDIDDGNGGVKLLVSQRGGEVEVVAICERESRERTADALARARIALGARGIALTTTVREKNEGATR